MAVSDLCVHHIPMKRSCPWCHRKGDPRTDLQAVKRPWQLYQTIFNDFLNEVSTQLQAPRSTVFLLLDMNGKLYSELNGSIEDVEAMLSTMLEQVREEIKQRKEDATLAN